jgi:putative transposase
MSNYLRPRRPGATIFFTVALAARGSDLLVREIRHLRQAVSLVRAERPFEIGAWVVLPDHMHCIWTLPDGDRDFSTRWGSIKARFTMSLRRAGFSPPSGLPVVQSGRYAGLKPGLRKTKREVGIWQRRFR